MAKKTVKTIGSLIKQTQQLLTTTTSAKPYIPDIVTFCESSEYLNLPNQPYDVQRIVLKAFYRGSEGNEKVTLTPEEIALCEEYGLNAKENGNILGKWDNGELFRELVLVWGRRSGKDFTISIIALYEAMKLLESPNGDPYTKYGLGKANPFTILTIANSQAQARILYNEIRDKFMAAPYFRDKFLPEGLTQDSIWMQTPEDKKLNIEYAAKGLPLKMGSIRVLSGHSNSDSLLGLGCYVLLLDEVASFKQTSGSGSGDRIYTALTPTIKTYARKKMDENGNLILDEKGKPIIIYDGKIISISSPRGMDGVFFNLYDKGDDVAHRIVCRLPTWRVNPNHTEDSLRNAEPQMTDERFMMEYGAKFSGTAGENFFPPEYVEKCFANNFPVRKHGELGVTYFAHLDPAISSHNYALCILHRHNYLNRETRKIDFIIVVDYMKIWTPKDGKPINIEEVDAEMIRLNRFFHLGLVTYDQWNSQGSINNLRRAGIPAMEARFNKSYKIKIYDELYSLVAQEKLVIPPFYATKSTLSLSIPPLKDEMLNLQRKFMAQGYRIYPKTEGEVRTDDCCDALAGACYNALKQDAQRLPQSALANTGYSPSGNQHLWRSMQGTPYGFGTGGQVARNLDQVAAYKNRPWG